MKALGIFERGTAIIMVGDFTCLGLLGWMVGQAAFAGLGHSWFRDRGDDGLVHNVMMMIIYTFV